MAPSSRERTAPWWVKVFVAFHVIAITLYALPIPSEQIRSGKKAPYGSDWILYEDWKYGRVNSLVQAYVFSTGFWQYWDMFSPDPARTDVYATADVIYKNGKILHYQYPRMFLLSIPQKFLQERYRKFLERAHDNEENSAKELKGFIRQRFAQRVALINDTDPSNPPVEVKLFLHSWDIPSPGKSLVPTYKSEQYFDYIVDEDLLAKDKRGTP